MAKCTKLQAQRNFNLYVARTKLLPGSDNPRNLVAFREKLVPIKDAMDLLDGEFTSAPTDHRAFEVLAEAFDLYESYMVPFAVEFLNRKTNDPLGFIALHFLASDPTEEIKKMFAYIGLNENGSIEFDGGWIATSNVAKENENNEISYLELYDFWIKARAVIEVQEWNPVKIRKFLKGESESSSKKGETWQLTRATSSQRSNPVLNESVAAL